MGLCEGHSLTRQGANGAALTDQQLLAVDVDLGAGPFAEQHRVVNFHIHRCQPAFIPRAGTYCDHCALLGLFLCRVGDDDAASRFRLGISAANDNTVMQGAKRDV
jgi:hypothetical protein